MTRAQFLSGLRQGLAGLPQDRIEDLVSDYDSHFVEGLAASRSEEQIAAALGDPARLARELRAEAGFRRWESERSAGSLLGVIIALLGLATIDLIFLLPLLGVLLGIFFALAGASIGLFVGGALLFLNMLVPGLYWLHLSDPIGGWLCALLGAGLCALGIGLAALFLILVHGAVRLLVRYARLHFRLIDSASRAA